MRDYLALRVIKEGEYIVSNNATVRETAKYFKVGKSTVHKDVTKRLKCIDLTLYKQVKKVLKINLDERHLRGGLATREKYKKLKEYTK